MTVEIKKHYYETGEIKAETPYSNGVRNGVEKCYHKTGEICKEIIYENDSLINIV